MPKTPLPVFRKLLGTYLGIWLRGHDDTCMNVPSGPGNPWSDLCKAADGVFSPYLQGRIAFCRGYARAANPHGGNPWDDKQDGIDWLRGYDEASRGQGPPLYLLAELAGMFIVLRDDHHLATFEPLQGAGHDVPTTKAQRAAYGHRMLTMLDAMDEAERELQEAPPEPVVAPPRSPGRLERFIDWCRIRR